MNVHTLSPGMVFTQLLLDDSTPELRKFPFGVLAAQPEEVAADLVPKILGVKVRVCACVCVCVRVCIARVRLTSPFRRRLTLFPRPTTTAHHHHSTDLSSQGNGQKVEFLTTDRILTQFYKKFVLGEKSEYIDDDGNVIKRPDAQYDELGVKTQY